MRVMLICGKAGHGKDTAAKFMKEELETLGQRVLIAHYADLVKYICRQFFGWNGEKDETGRGLLQYVGTDIVRQRCEDYWVDFIIDMLDFFGDNWDFVLIPDCRFPNEISKIEEKHPTCRVRVVRPDYISQLTYEQMNHPSETSLDGAYADYTLVNDGTEDDLKNKVREFVDGMKEYLHE